MTKKTLIKLAEITAALSDIVAKEILENNDISMYDAKIDLSKYDMPIAFGGEKKKEKKNEK